MAIKICLTALLVFVICSGIARQVPYRWEYTSPNKAALLGGVIGVSFVIMVVSAICAIWSASIN